MTRFTEKAIMDTFVEMLEEMPLEKITIQKIIKRVNISRTTFYYHFGDIYALLDAVLQRNLTLLFVNNATSDDDCADNLHLLFDYMYQNRKMLYHIYQSVTHSMLEQYLYKATEKFFQRHIALATEDMAIDEKDLQFLCFAYQSMLVGIILDWLRHGMNHNLNDLLEPAARLLNIRRMLGGESLSPHLTPNVLKGVRN